MVEPSERTISGVHFEEERLLVSGNATASGLPWDRGEATEDLALVGLDEAQGGALIVATGVEIVGFETIS